MKKKIFLVGLISALLITGLFGLTGCGNSNENGKVSSNSEEINEKASSNSEETKEDYQETNDFILKDHKGYYNEKKDKYIVEGTLVNKTDETFEDKYVMIRLYSKDEKMISVAECLVEKLEPHDEIKIIAKTPTLSKKAKEIVKYVLSSL